MTYRNAIRKLRMIASYRLHTCVSPDDKQDGRALYGIAKSFEAAMRDRKRLAKQVRRLDPDNQVLKEIFEAKNGN